MITLFEAHLYGTQNIGTDAQVKTLKDEILNLKSTQQSTTFSNAGCWRGQQPLQNVGFLLDAIDRMVLDNIKEYSKKDQFFANNVEPKWNIDYWMNVNEPGSRNEMHSHSPSVFSGTYYLQGTGTGELRLINPANILNNCNVQAPFVRDARIAPNDKDLLMWPAWIPHEVLTNFSDRQRINIAYDIHFTS